MNCNKITWKKLNKKELDKLRDGSLSFLVFSPGHPKFPYNVCQWFDSKSLGLSDKEMETCWRSLVIKAEDFEYDDETFLAIYSYYCVINKPK